MAENFSMRPAIKASDGKFSNDLKMPLSDPNPGNIPGNFSLDVSVNKVKVRLPDLSILTLGPADGGITLLNTGNGLTGGPISTTGTVSLIAPVTAVNGGTGQISYAVGDVLYADTTTTLNRLPAAATGNVLLSGAIPSWGKVNLVTAVTGMLPALFGGTGISSYTKGDLLVASSSTTLTQLPGVAVGNVLLSDGLATPPQYGKVNLATMVTGVLPIANGGTGIATVLNDGQFLIGDTGSPPVAGNITAGTGITVINGAGTILLTNSGVTSLIAGSGISVSGATGAVTVSNGGVLNVTGTPGQCVVGGTLVNRIISFTDPVIMPGTVTFTREHSRLDGPMAIGPTVNVAPTPGFGSGSNPTAGTVSGTAAAPVPFSIAIVFPTPYLSTDISVMISAFGNASFHQAQMIVVAAGLGGFTVVGASPGAAFPFSFSYRVIGLDP